MAQFVIRLGKVFPIPGVKLYMAYFPYQESTNPNTKLTGTVEYQHKQEQSSGDVDRNLMCLCEKTNKSTMRKFKTLKPASQISIQHPTRDPSYVNSPNHCLKSSNPLLTMQSSLAAQPFKAELLEGTTKNLSKVV